MKPNRLCAGCVLLCALYACPAAAQTLNEDFKLTALDANDDYMLGSSVAISGTTTVVGAPGEYVSSGSAYIFDTTTGQQMFKLKSSDYVWYDYFGYSVAVSGTTAIIGAYGNDDAGESSGSAYIFDTTTGQQMFKLTATDAGTNDFFGFSVAISGTTAVVGARGGNGLAGSAYLFDTTTGQQMFKLTATDAGSNDEFGFSVAISGTTALIGAFGNDDAGENSGSVYLFDTTTGQQVFKLTASDAEEHDGFGRKVAISGTTAVIGAQYSNSGGNNAGAVYLFDTTTGQQMFKLTASDAASNDDFGRSVAISGTTAIVGADSNDDGGNDSGSAYLFDTTTGQQLFKLSASDAEVGDVFGSSVAISGNIAIVGARGDNNGDNNSGSAYLFDGQNDIVQQPQGVIVDSGVTASFSVILEEPAGVTYQWRRDGIDLVEGARIRGAQTALLRVQAFGSEVAYYDCTISSVFGPSVSTNAVILGVRPEPNPCIADLNGDQELDFLDISAFLSGYSDGCP